MDDKAVPRRSSPGFTLLEVLVAFIIAGLAIAALVQAGAAGLNATHNATRYQEALARARSHLAAATHGQPLAPGDSDGDDGDGFHWRLQVTTLATTLIRPVGTLQRPPIPATLYQVSTSIFWREGRQLRRMRLDTEQIGQ